MYTTGGCEEGHTPKYRNIWRPGLLALSAIHNGLRSFRVRHRCLWPSLTNLGDSTLLDSGRHNIVAAAPSSGRIRTGGRFVGKTSEGPVVLEGRGSIGSGIPESASGVLRGRGRHHPCGGRHRKRGYHLSSLERLGYHGYVRLSLERKQTCRGGWRHTPEERAAALFSCTP